MIVDYLIDHPEHIETVAKWNFEEWSYLFEGSTLEGFIRGAHSVLGKSQVPCTLIAIKEGSVIGSVSMIPEENAERKDLSPWLSCMYVKPSSRGEGVGRLLDARLIEVATELGRATVYLEALDKHVGFYAKLGWEILEKRQYRGQSVTIMQKQTKAGSQN